MAQSTFTLPHLTRPQCSRSAPPQPTSRCPAASVEVSPPSLRQIASQKAKHEAKMSGLGTGVAKLRGLSRLVYSSPASQTFFAVVIIASFGASCVDAEIQPDEGSQVKRCDTLPVQGCAHAIAALRN